MCVCVLWCDLARLLIFTWTASFPEALAWPPALVRAMSDLCRDSLCFDSHARAFLLYSIAGPGSVFPSDHWGIVADITFTAGED